jgi:hypothetical protein
MVEQTLAWIVPKHAVNNDRELAVREPPLRPIPGLRLHCRRRHQEKGHDADYEGDKSFDQEEPSAWILALDRGEFVNLPPPGESTMAIEVEDGIGQQRRDDAGDAQRGPEETEPDWQLAAGVEVREPKD